MADIFFYIASKELKIAQITQVNQLFQLLNLVCIHGYGFYELGCMLMRKNVNNGVQYTPYSKLAATLPFYIYIPPCLDCTCRIQMKFYLKTRHQ